MQFTSSLVILTLAASTLAAPPLHVRNNPAPTSPSQEVTCSQDVGVEACCTGASTKSKATTSFFSGLVKQDPRLENAVSILSPVISLLGPILGPFRCQRWRYSAISIGVLSTLNPNFVNCGDAKPKCCVLPKNNSPTSTVNNGLINANILTGDIVFCPDMEILS